MKSDDATIPYFYKMITVKPKANNKSSFKHKTLCSHTGSFKFVWDGVKDFEQLKRGNWQAMFFYAKNLSADKKSYEIGTLAEKGISAYKLGEDLDITDLDIPFFSDWQKVKIVPHITTDSHNASGLKPTYTLQLGVHHLKSRGIITRVHFSNTLNLALKVRSFKVETNAYKFKGTFDISQATLKDKGVPQFSYTPTTLSTNIKNEPCYIKEFTFATEVDVPKRKSETEAGEGLSDCLFWMMPMEKKNAPTKPYTQIYLNAYAPSHKLTNANGHIADDSPNALKGKAKGGIIDHGAVANVPLASQAPSMVNLPVYARTTEHTAEFETQVNKCVRAVLDIRRPKTFVEWIAETPATPRTLPQGGNNPRRGALGFATDLSYPDVMTTLYHKVNNQWAVTDKYKNVAPELYDQSAFHYDYETAIDIIRNSGYAMPSDRHWFAYCIQPYKGYKTRTKVESGYMNNGGLYKARKDASSNPQEYETLISEAKPLNGGTVIYAMRFKTVGEEQYRVLTRYFAYDDTSDVNYPFLFWNSTRKVSYDDPFNDPNMHQPVGKLKEKPKTGRENVHPYMALGAYQSVTVRYVGKNYVFNDDPIMVGENPIWATEAFWDNEDLNRDDIVRYYPMYGYSFNMCFRNTGLMGLYWTSKDVFSWKKLVKFKDVFVVVNDGFDEQANFQAEHRYGADVGIYRDFMPVIPVTNKDWGE